MVVPSSKKKINLPIFFFNRETQCLFEAVIEITKFVRLRKVVGIFSRNSYASNPGLIASRCA